MWNEGPSVTAAKVIISAYLSHGPAARRLLEGYCRQRRVKEDVPAVLAEMREQGLVEIIGAKRGSQYQLTKKGREAFGA